MILPKKKIAWNKGIFSLIEKEEEIKDDSSVDSDCFKDLDFLKWCDREHKEVDSDTCKKELYEIYQKEILTPIKVLNNALENSPSFRKHEIGDIQVELNYLEKAFGEPTITPSDHEDKIFYMWKLELETETETFNIFIYDWKEDKAPDYDDGNISWNITSYEDINKNKALLLVKGCLNMVKKNLTNSKYDDGRNYPIFTKNKLGETEQYS